VIAASVGDTNSFAAAYIGSTEVFSDVSQSASLAVPSLANAVKEPDFKQYSSRDKIKRFWKSGKFFESRGFGW